VQVGGVAVVIPDVPAAAQYLSDQVSIPLPVCSRRELPGDGDVETQLDELTDMMSSFLPGAPLTGWSALVPTRSPAS
jgi:hypothetical protein